MKKVFNFIIVCLLFLLFNGCCVFQSSNYKSNQLNGLVDNAIKKSLDCLAKSVEEVKDSSLYPTYATKDLKWKLKKSSDWTSGFYPGCLWQAYELSNEQRFNPSCS